MAAGVRGGCANESRSLTAAIEDKAKLENMSERLEEWKGYKVVLYVCLASHERCGPGATGVHGGERGFDGAC